MTCRRISRVRAVARAQMASVVGLLVCFFGASLGRRLERRRMHESRFEFLNFLLTKELSNRSVMSRTTWALDKLPSEGVWKCSEKSSFLSTSQSHFTSVPVLDLRERENEQYASKLAEEAQLRGWPLLIRRPISARHEADTWARLERATSDMELELKKVKTFNPTSRNWAGAKRLTSSELSRLHTDALRGNSSFAGFLDAVRAGVTYRGDKDNLIPLGLKYTTGASGFIQRRKHRQQFESDTTPVWHDDGLDYSTFFVHGTGYRSAAHVDDSNGASYFYLKVLAGHKRMRLWPIFDGYELQAWVDAEDNMPEQVEHAYRGFLYSPELNSGLPWRWTERGFEWGAISQSIDKHTKLHGPSRESYRCFVEVDIKAGEEIFIGSAVPHEVDTIKPSVATSRNYRFTNWGVMTERQAQAITTATLSKDSKENGPIIDIDDVIDMEHYAATGEQSKRWRELWKAGVHSKTVTTLPSDSNSLVADVLLAWSDPSIAADPDAVRSVFLKADKHM
eukprot:TRINITY_DN28419_c0_g1_i1.p1 TRINITY_DN28419_c0_g1~~TRINITY_DN28419_c0_g1_i1.p1  ORF type:complete len:507 (+),score=28.92 TRINITY_DN28419_c0_g1_i1:67-1587(+)